MLAINYRQLENGKEKQREDAQIIAKRIKIIQFIN